MRRRRRENFRGKSTIVHARRGLGDSNQKTHTRYFGNLKYDVILGGTGGQPNMTKYDGGRGVSKI